ncbi:MAG: metal ABC transporter ATP-binding protein [Vulcanibacillus sp.]
MSNNVVVIKNLTFKYSNQVILDDINLTIKSNDFLGLIGPNGSGKTTLLKAILGLLPIQQGEIFLFDKPLNKFAVWSNVGYVSQKANSFNSGFPATVYEVVAMGLYGKKGLFRRLNSSDIEQVYKTIETVGLEDYTKRSIGKLSGGQQQRAFVARALVSQPKLLILDEPTVGVDTESTNQFYLLLEKLNKEKNITIILVSHDIGVVTNKVSNIACLNRKLLYHGEPEFYNTDSCNILQNMYGEDMKIVSHNHHTGE